VIAPPGALVEGAAPVAGRRTAESAVALLLLLVPFILRLTMIFEPVVDPDIWWHLAAGRWIAEHGAVPVVDPFMTRGVAHVWLDYSWLVDAGLWLGYRAVELAAPVVYSITMAGLFLLVCSWLVRREGSDLVRRSFVAAVGFMAICTHLGPRTYLFTMLFTGITLCFIRACLRGAEVRRGYWLLPMFALWANVHIEFIYALFFLGLATLDRLVRATLREPAEGPSWKQLAVLTTASLATTLVNPFGLRLHGLIVAMLGPYKASDFVSEMRSNAFRSPIDYFMLLLFGAAIFTLARRRSHELYSWGALAVSAYMSFHSGRVSWLVSLVALDILGDHPLLYRALATETTPRLFRFLLPSAVGLAVMVLVTRAVGARDRLVPSKIYPFAATSFVREHALGGPLYNDWNWGGFFRFQLPDVQGNIDGRGPIFGIDVPLATIDTWKGKPSWKTDPDLDRAGFVIADTKTALSQLLRFDPRFRAAYEDDLAVVFVREGR
jgi:hypothetical protein